MATSAPFYYGWLVLGVGGLATFAGTGISQSVLGGIQNLIFEDMGWDRSTIAFAVTAGTWTSGLISPLFGRVADRYGPRGLMPLAALVAGVSFLALSGIQEVWHFYLAFIIGRAMVTPVFLGVVNNTVAVNFFQRRRGFAMGLVAMGRPVGGALTIQIMSLIALGYSWRVAYRYQAIFAFVMVVPLLLVMRRRPEDIGLAPDGDPPNLAGEATPRRGSASVSQSASGRKEFDWRGGEAVMTPTFWLVGSAMAVTVMIFGAMQFQVVPYLRDSGLSQATAAGGLSLSWLLGGPAFPSWGYLSDRFSARRLALGMLVMSAMIMLLLLSGGGGYRGFVLKSSGAYLPRR